MKTFPFYTPPESSHEAVGDEVSGIIKIRKIGDVTLAERLFVDEELKQEDDSSVLVAKLATVVAKKKKLPTRVAAAIVWGNSNESIQKELDDAGVKVQVVPEKVREEFYEEILLTTKKIAEYAEKRSLAQAKALVFKRLIGDPTEAKAFFDTLSVTMVAHLANFWNKEENHWAEAAK